MFRANRFHTSKVNLKNNPSELFLYDINNCNAICLGFFYKYYSHYIRSMFCKLRVKLVM